MTKEQLIALRTCVQRAEHAIRLQSRNKNTLGWMKELRHAWQAIRQITHEWIEKNPRKETT